MTITQRLFILLSVLWSVTTFTAVAPASTYEVHTCREEVREPLPAPDWSIIGPETDFRADTDCKLRPIFARPEGPGLTAPGNAGGVRFSVPKPLAIVGFKYRSVIHTTGSLYPPGQWWWDFLWQETTYEGKTQRTGACPGQMYWSCSERYSLTSYNGIDKKLSSVDWVFMCSPQSPQACPSSSEVDVTIFDGVFKIEDSDSPVIAGQPGGAMFASVANLSGEQTIAFQASDRGSGVYRAVVEVDGAVMGEIGLSREAPGCQPPFHVVRPCPSEVVSSVVVDTTRLADGQHDAALKVYDTSDENPAVYGPVSFSTSNRTVSSFCASEDPARFALRVPRKPLRFGKGWRLAGRVKDALGWEAVVLDGKRRVKILNATSVSRTGNLGVTVARGPNRYVRVAVRPPGSRNKYFCSVPVLVRAKPRLTLKVNPPEIANGASVRLHGRLHGHARGRKAIVIQARALGSRRWATVRVVRTDSRGQYGMRYRFRNSSAGTTYVFRSQARGERGYPYSTGTSRYRRLRIIGA